MCNAFFPVGKPYRPKSRDCALHAKVGYIITAKMPRRLKLEEEAKQKAWAIAHPPIVVSASHKSPMSDARKLVATILASGVTGVVGTLLSTYLSVAGVNDSMTAAKIILIISGIVMFAGVLVSEWVWGKSRSGRVLWITATGVFLICSLWGLNVWTSRYRLANQVAHNPPLSPGSAIIKMVGKDNVVINSTITNSTVNQSPNGGAAIPRR
jgi:hypothetical protein